MSLALFIALAVSSQASPAEPAAEYGFVEFEKDPNLFAGHSIQIFVVLEEKNRLLYVDELGSTGLRSVTVKTPVGKREFVVIVEPNDGTRARGGAPSNPVRRNRPNVTLTVESGMTTHVMIGGFTDFVRAPTQGDVTGTKFVRAANDQEASQFRIQIAVGKPKKN